MDKFEDFIGKKVVDITIKDNKVVIEFDKELIEIKPSVENSMRIELALEVNRVQIPPLESGGKIKK